MIHVLNAPSPAATASITIGRTIAAQAAERFGLAGASLPACIGHPAETAGMEADERHQASRPHDIGAPA